MSFPRYPEYKDSGVEWLGEVPVHWELTRVRRLFRIEKRIAGTDRYDVLSITQQGIKIKDIESGDGQLSMDYSKYQIVDIGDFAMNHMDLITGYVDVSKHIGVTSPDYRVFRLINDEHSVRRYYLYLFQNAYRNRIFFPFGQGSAQLGRWRLPTDEFNSFPLPSPTLREQQQIAVFLDRETAKIDALIAEQQRLIELLKEKRQAVISHAVTKGLNPNAPMKDSGIEWLGEVPAHWGLSKLKHAISKIIDNRGRTPEFGDEGIPMLEVKQITEGTRYPTNSFEKFVKPQIVEQFERDKVLDGDVLLTTVGATAGKAVIVDKNPDYFIVQNVIGLRSVTNVYNIFLYYTIISDYFFHSLFSINKSNTIDNLKVSVFINNFCLVPPIEEQFEIAVFIDNELVKLDALTAEAKNGIELLKERRTALISAAVTGKIDVRGFVLSEYQ